MRRALMSISIAVLGGAQTYVPPASERPPQLQNVQIEPRLGARMPLDTEFRDEAGRPVRLRDVLRDRPAVLAFVYYGCPRLCSMTLTGLVRALRAIPLKAGQQFDVIAISIDPREMPELAAAKKQRFVETYGRGGGDGWHFLVGTKPQILRATSAAGFGFEYDAKLDTFAHPAGLIVLTPQGRIAKYFYGVEFDARDLRLALVDASAGRIGTLGDQILLYCFQYDPHTGRYSLAVTRAVRISAALSVMGLVAAVFLAVRRERRRGMT